jgi:hypothetical protein
LAICPQYYLSQDVVQRYRGILKNKEYNWETADREEFLRVLNDIEDYTQTEGDAELYFDVIRCDHPIAIQVFTRIEHKGENFDVILDFEMTTPSNENDLIDTVWEEYEKALDNINFFKS